MTLIKLRYVQAFMARGRKFYYFRRPGSPRQRLPGIPGSAEFMKAYEAALDDGPRIEIGASRTKPGTVNAAIVAYYGSTAFNDLAPAVQRFRRNVIEAFRQQRGDRPLKGLERRHIIAMMEKIPKPHARINWLKAIRGLMQKAVDLGLLVVDPTAGIKMKTPKSDGFLTWGEPEIEIYRAHHSLGTMARLALDLFLNTAQPAMSSIWGDSTFMTARSMCASARPE